MTHRQFLDEDFVAWHVLEVFPNGRDRDSGTLDEWPSPGDGDGDGAHGNAVEMRQLMAVGWLVFQSVRERRRLSPIPADWKEASDRELAELCARAQRVVPPT
jgi:hypothetical protein